MATDWLAMAGEESQERLVELCLWEVLAKPVWATEEIVLALAVRLYGEPFQRVVDLARSPGLYGTTGWHGAFREWTATRRKALGLPPLSGPHTVQRQLPP